MEIVVPHRRLGDGRGEFVSHRRHPHRIDPHLRRVLNDRLGRGENAKRIAVSRDIG
jgi:hypothetical protein